MKTYNLEFSYFDGSCWERFTVEIIHTSLIGLIKAFIKETEVIYEPDPKGKFLSKKQMIKNCWNVYKKNIRQEELVFPIIKRQ